MTTNTIPDRVQLTADVERLAAALTQARDDIDLLARLKTAEADEKRLVRELRTAQEQLAERNASDLMAQREARYAGFSDISVTEESHAYMGDSIMHTVFKITVTQREWNGHENFPVTRVYPSFNALPDEAFNYLLEQHPDRIPAKIMALDPSNAWEAFREYFTSLRRGWFKGPVAA